MYVPLKSGQDQWLAKYTMCKIWVLKKFGPEKSRNYINFNLIAKLNYYSIDAVVSLILTCSSNPATTTHLWKFIFSPNSNPIIRLKLGKVHRLSREHKDIINLEVT